MVAILSGFFEVRPQACQGHVEDRALKKPLKSAAIWTVPLGAQ